MKNLFAGIPLEMSYTCPACKRNFQIPSDFSEHSYPCPHCGKVFFLTAEDLEDHARGQLALDMLRDNPELI